MAEQGWNERDEVHVHEWLLWAWRAWHRLSFDRPVYIGGLGGALPGRISWRMVVDWAEYHDQDAEFLDAAVIEMDNVYLEWAAEKLKTK